MTPKNLYEPIMDDRNGKYERAQKRVKELKGFYNHLKIFVLINGFFYLLKAGVFDWVAPEGFVVESYYFDWVHANVLVWLVILLVHFLILNRNRMPFLKKWEERQIKKYMAEEKNQNNKFK